MVTDTITHKSVLFADISGSTALYESAGDVTAKRIISTAQSGLSAIAKKNSGALIKTIGDEVMYVFPTADDAFNASIGMQSTNFGEKANGVLFVRIGFNHGEVIEENNDVFGDTVNTAARMAEIAKGGQIITTEQTLKHLSSEHISKVRKIDQMKVKGKADVLSIYQVVWEHVGLITAIVANHADHLAHAKATMRMCYHDEVLKFDSSRCVTIGRDMGCDLVTNSKLASRHHAKVEYSRGKFTYTDQSTNGSYIKTEDGRGVYLKRESFALFGVGSISFGSKHDPADLNVISFTCEGEAIS